MEELFAMHDKYYKQGINTCEGCLHYGAATCYGREDWKNECQKTLNKNIEKAKAVTNGMEHNKL